MALVWAVLGGYKPMVVYLIKHFCVIQVCMRWLLKFDQVQVSEVYLSVLYYGYKLYLMPVINTSSPSAAPLNWVSIDSDNGLSPGWHQAIIWNNSGIFLIEPLGTNFSENLIKIHVFSFKKMHLKMLSAKWQPSCFSLNMLMLTQWGQKINILNMHYFRWLSVIITSGCERGGGGLDGCESFVIIGKSSQGCQWVKCDHQVWWWDGRWSRWLRTICNH